MSSDATAVRTQKQPSSKPKRWTRTVTIFTCVGLLVLGLMIFFALWVVGITHGREFEAGSWTFRRFAFIRNPITGNQLTGIQHSADFPVPPGITPFITGGPLSPVTRWDLVEIAKGPVSCNGDAQILLSYLSALDLQNNYFWSNWSTKYPKAAPVLWSAVRDWVHLPRYDRLPEIFEAARAQTDPAKLTPVLKSIMLDIADDEIKLQASLGNDAGQQRAQKLKAAYLEDTVSPARAEVEQLP